MPTTIAIRFPLGRYHATPWDRSVNEGAAEWPPSPWRLLRALIATWYTRWPDLPAEAFDTLLGALGDPPSYLTPPARPGHTRHYMPGLDHKSGLPDARKQRPKAEKNDPSGRDLIFDPFLSVRAQAQSGRNPTNCWSGGMRTSMPRSGSVLAKLVELLPYLGRADSVCEARLLDDDPVPDETWWRPGAEGDRTTRLLAPARPVSRAALEVTTVQVRKMRRTQPPGTVWVSYAAAGEEAVRRERRPAVRPVDAVRLAVMSRAPAKLTHGILLADAAHAAAARKFPDDVSRHIVGYRGAATDHQHAHWVPLPDPAGPADRVQTLLVYVPYGLTADEVSRLIGIRHISGRVGVTDGNGSGYEFRDLPAVDLLLHAAGPVRQVAPELCGPARRWRSLTPYLPVRHWHRNRETLAEFLATDVNAELSYRDPSANRVRASPDLRRPETWARGFRRYRMKEHLGKARCGLGLVLEFPEAVPGPLLLGQLSHFGYGAFVPDAE